MARYAVKFSAVTGKSSVHTTKCTQARKKPGFVVTLVDADNAKAAAAQYAEANELAALGRPLPVPCACTRYIEAIRSQGWYADAEERAYCRRIGKAIEKRIEQ